MQVSENATDFDSFYAVVRKQIPAEYHDILNQDVVEKWIRRGYKMKSEGIEPATAVINARYLFEFSEFVKKAPDKIIELATKAPDDWSDKLEDWEILLQKKYTNRDTIRRKLIIAKSFLESHHVELDYDLPAGEKHDRPWVPAKILLRKAFTLFRERRMREWLLLQSQTGLSEIDLILLDVDDSNKDENRGPVYDSIRDQMRKGMCPVHVVLKRKKTRVTTETFIGEEALSLIDGKFEGSHLFKWKVDVEKAKDPAKQVQRSFAALRKNHGLPDKFSPHKLRRYFKTSLRFSGVDREMVFFMMGHKQAGMDEFYLGALTEKLKALYVRAYPDLRLFDPKRMSELATLTWDDLSEDEKKGKDTMVPVA